MNRLLASNSDNLGPAGGWQDDPAGIDEARTARVGLRVLLAVISSLFMLFLIAFILRSQVPDWQPLTEPMAPLAQPWALWLNTAFLICASIALQWARVSARRGQAKATVTAFSLGGGLAIAFLAGQLWVWQQFVAWGYFVASNPANSFFYLLTGLHGLHLLGGLLAWAIILSKLLLGVPLAQLSNKVELCAIYWHYLLGLWLLLFALLTSTPQTYEAIAAFCGLR
ncbi:cytochrome c oxidase subunit 3 [Pseudomonas sp.]|uniref:cytochrome c oxidase subunit 3 n=1 Tax=Pseudomonas sp. TaxID=306 RepID=UPI0027361590|nr:cytochrome c oxidase subunit 3 [Pseudomonas sp.]MDP3816946.1 cytochrome c oxidase subunit 3 [Pseudomonas sp.]